MLPEDEWFANHAESAIKMLTVNAILEKEEVTSPTVATSETALPPIEE